MALVIKKHGQKVPVVRIKYNQQWLFFGHWVRQSLGYFEGVNTIILKSMTFPKCEHWIEFGNRRKFWDTCSRSRPVWRWVSSKIRCRNLSVETERNPYKFWEDIFLNELLVYTLKLALLYLKNQTFGSLLFLFICIEKVSLYSKRARDNWRSPFLLSWSISCNHVYFFIYCFCNFDVRLTTFVASLNILICSKLYKTQGKREQNYEFPIAPSLSTAFVYLDFESIVYTPDCRCFNYESQGIWAWDFKLYRWRIGSLFVQNIRWTFEC